MRRTWMSIKVHNYLEEKIVWKQGREPVYPYTADVSGERCLIRINDFPNDHLYTLIVNDKEVVSFDDWPEHWSRP
jgi:hypothetical protein